MNIPSLPTDNLYKFCAILGLTLFVFNTYYSTEMSYKSEEEGIKAKSETELSRSSDKPLESELKILETEIKTAKGHLKYSCESLELNEAARAKFMIDGKQSIEFEALIINLNNQIKDGENEVNKLYEKQDQLLQNKIVEKQNLITKNELQMLAKNKSFKYRLYLIIGNVIGIYLAFWGFLGWRKMEKRNELIIS